MTNRLLYVQPRLRRYYKVYCRVNKNLFDFKRCAGNLFMFICIFLFYLLLTTIIVIGVSPLIIPIYISCNPVFTALDKRGHVILFSRLQKLIVTLTSNPRNEILLSPNQVLNIHNGKNQFINFLPYTNSIGLSHPSIHKQAILNSSQELLYLKRFIIPRVSTYTEWSSSNIIRIPENEVDAALLRSRQLLLEEGICNSKDWIAKYGVESPLNLELLSFDQTSIPVGMTSKLGLLALTDPF